MVKSGREITIFSELHNITPHKYLLLLIRKVCKLP